VTDASTGPALPSPARWAVLEPFLDAALVLAPDERRAYLDDACGVDGSVRTEVDRLLAAYELRSTTLSLEQPAAVRFASLLDERVDEATFEEAIAEQFRLAGELGRGGMAIVYRATDLRDGSRVALKVLRATSTAGGAARFRREIALAARLRHPRILPLLDSGVCGDRLWYTMPLVAGESLGALLHREGRVPIIHAVRMLSEISEALACAHAHGVVHRDLKPHNVLLADGHAVIADFGVAKALFTATYGDLATTQGDHIRTATGAGVGTPAYMSPEQAAGEKSVDHRADLYALGVIAYELLTGAPPFTGQSRQALITAHLAERPAPPSVHRGDIPRALEALVMRLLEKQATNRPGSATDVIAVLAMVS
jgi:serine/threonine protein kinase